MTRTRPLLLVLLAGGAAVVAAALQVALGSLGYSRIVPPLTLAATLVLIGVVVVLLALPVRRATRGTPPRPVDPFYATRVVLIAKASAVTAALLGGAAIGVLVELLARTVTSPAMIWAAVTVLVGAAVMVAGALVAEHWCTVPPEDDDALPDAPAA